MNIFSFTANFGTEESCRIHFKEELDKIGNQCKCESKEHFWIKVFGVMNVKNVATEFLYEVKHFTKL